VTDADGRYSFTQVRPGAYPWANHRNAWRPAHIHFSLFGRAFVQRLVTQMYFPDDPLFGQDPIYGAVPEAARGRLASEPPLARGHGRGLGTDVPVRHRAARCGRHAVRAAAATQALLTPSQTAGPFLSLALRWPDGPDVLPAETPGSLWLRGRVLDAAGAVVPDALVETWQADVDGTYPHPADRQ